ncbi:hypothetical protein HNR46_001176 [Haloferula luteola]|uniref:Uncharacterized protein n=1 Tax=Haloferula luteola TaxID=595692 RepID=A0A840UYT3_9BACT|nr:hypothetical protein [Haloferula luteola]
MGIFAWVSSIQSRKVLQITQSIRVNFVWNLPRSVAAAPPIKIRLPMQFELTILPHRMVRVALSRSSCRNPA